VALMTGLYASMSFTNAQPKIDLTADKLCRYRRKIPAKRLILLALKTP
jgi:hypothetical protein